MLHQITSESIQLRKIGRVIPSPIDPSSGPCSLPPVFPRHCLDTPVGRGWRRGIILSKMLKHEQSKITKPWNDRHVKMQAYFPFNPLTPPPPLSETPTFPKKILEFWVGLQGVMNTKEMVENHSLFYGKDNIYRTCRDQLLL